MDTTIPLPTTTITPPEGPLRAYFRTLFRVLLSPSLYFREDISRLQLRQTLTFGLVSAWLASGFAFFFETVNSLLLARVFEDFLYQMVETEYLLGPSRDSFLWSAGLLLLAPFFFLLKVFLGSSVLYLFLRLLADDTPASREPITLSGVMRIHSSALASRWFLVVPLLGGLIAFFVNLILLVTGIRERFQLSTRRAALVVLAPYLLMALAAVFLLIVGAVIITQIPFADLLVGGEA
jgi:hypothetical protein